MSIVDTQVPASTRSLRINYGIDVCVGPNQKPLNEWAIHESTAKLVHEMLILNGDEPLPPTADGIVYKRRALSDDKAELAAMKVTLLASKQAQAA